MRSLLFTEYVAFRNADGDPIEVRADGGEAAVAATRRFLTLGAQTVVGDWRGALAWQREANRRSFNPIPTQDWIEASVGRDLARGLGLDLGYQYARFAREDGTRGPSHSIVGRLSVRLTR